MKKKIYDFEKYCIFANYQNCHILEKITENIIQYISAIAMIIIALTFLSCSGRQNEQIVVSRDFPEEQWGRFDNVTATFNAVKTPATVDVIMEITVSDDFPDVYEYYKSENEFAFCMSFEGADGSRRAREYSFVLKDGDGNWKSEKIDGYYHFQFSLISELNINEIGENKFNIENKYPRDPLYGIKNLTLKCVPSRMK